MDLLDVLRRQAGRFQCPQCGKSLANCGLELVGTTDQASLVKVTCAHCEGTRLVAVAVETEVEARPAPVRDQPMDARGAITADELLDVSLAVREHAGDLKSLLERRDMPRNDPRP